MEHLYATNIFDIRRQAMVEAQMTAASGEPAEKLLERADKFLEWYLSDLPSKEY